MEKLPLYIVLARLVQAYNNCLIDKKDCRLKHKERIEKLVKEYMPSGSGIDRTRFVLTNDAGTIFSTGEKLMFTTSFHHMDRHGYYKACTNHIITVVPSLQFGFIVKVSGFNKDIKNYLCEVFRDALEQNIDNE